MADLSDVTAYLAQQAAAAVYPNGTSQPSVAAMDCRIFEGWPLPDQLDRDMLGQTLAGSPSAPASRPGGTVANVSIYPLPGTGVAVYQILDETYLITPPAISTTFTLVGNLITVSGALSSGEYLTLVIDDAVVCSQTGANVAAMLAALAAQAVAAGYAATSTATTLTIPFGHSLVVRQGGKAVQGKVTHRQRHSIMVTVWAPTHAARSTLASAIDNLIKQSNKVAMPDTSQAIVVYSRTNISDELQAAAIYRRDLIYDVEYATVEQFPAYVITSVQVSIAKPDNSAIATALT
ncbi:hypothetical protein [Bradyrhizobium lablabi]|uniref:hypothetical protein n=1 Tax=Bradyrhizobium lablabi TaxID=722472 RepID=UPI001BA4CDC1|nr:hypothetical protein [Bradyrhizobium lablabi]MBR0693673.1 hypothetical protein [Bradyrhizobium lablabi]